MREIDSKTAKIISDRSMNEFPIEERIIIRKYTAQQQITTLWQVITAYEMLICPTLQKKLKKWLKDCVEMYCKNYEDLDVERYKK